MYYSTLPRLISILDGAGATRIKEVRAVVIQEQVEFRDDNDMVVIGNKITYDCPLFDSMKHVSVGDTIVDNGKQKIAEIDYQLTNKRIKLTIQNRKVRKGRN